MYSAEGSVSQANIYGTVALTAVYSAEGSVSQANICMVLLPSQLYLGEGAEVVLSAVCDVLLQSL